jgi:hypothetical protein
MIRSFTLILLSLGAVYLFLLRNRSVKFEVEFELGPQGEEDNEEDEKTATETTATMP